MRQYFTILLAVVLLTACSQQGAKDKNNNAAVIDSLKTDYAAGFGIKYHPSFKEVIVYSPWVKGSVYARYYLVKDISTKNARGWNQGKNTAENHCRGHR